MHILLCGYTLAKRQRNLNKEITKLYMEYKCARFHDIP